MTLLRMMKLVAYFAVAFACIGPMLRMWQMNAGQRGSSQGLVAVALFEAVAVPLAWAGLSLLIVRRGEGRDRLIAAMLLASVLAAWGVAVWVFFAYTATLFSRGFDPYEGWGGVVRWLSLNSLAILALSAALVFLASRLRRRSGARDSM